MEAQAIKQGLNANRKETPFVEASVRHRYYSPHPAFASSPENNRAFHFRLHLFECSSDDSVKLLLHILVSAEDFFCQLLTPYDLLKYLNCQNSAITLSWTAFSDHECPNSKKGLIP